MRITNGMMVNTLNRNIAGNLGRMDMIQNRMATGRKFANISDDPLALIYSQSARNMMARIDNFRRSTLTAGDWLRQAEDGIMDLQRTMVDLYVETVNAADDAKGVGPEAGRTNIAPVISQLRQSLVDNLNVTLGDRFMFGGHNTPGDPANTLEDKTTRPFTVENGALHFNGFNISQFDGMPAQAFNTLFRGENPPTEAEITAAFSTLSGFAPEDFNLDGPGGEATAAVMHRLINDVPTFIVGAGISMPATMNGIELAMFPTRETDADGNSIHVMRSSWDLVGELYEHVQAGADAEVIGEFIRPLQDAQRHLLTQTAEIGGRVRRLEMLEARYEQSMINFERMRSEAEDVDFAETMLHFKMAEAVYQAALSAGARVIQPTLMDFLR